MAGKGLILPRGGTHVVFLELRRDSRVTTGDYRLPFVSAQGNPSFYSTGEGKLGVALESLQGQRDLIKACVRELIFLSREGRDLGVASHAPPGSQASPREEAKDSALLPSRDADILVPPEWPQGSPASSSLLREES